MLFSFLPLLRSFRSFVLSISVSALCVSCLVWAFRWKALFIRARSEVVVPRRHFGLGKADDTAKLRPCYFISQTDG